MNADAPWRSSDLAANLLNDAVATLECRTESRIPMGDHEIYIERVKHCSKIDRDLLVFYRGCYTALGEIL
jgi:3-hydroxy-9,10-secoandrosta-1,3,5(10)-triene-9,17-dione monooxygenase reductase component